MYRNDPENTRPSGSYLEVSAGYQNYARKRRLLKQQRPQASIVMPAFNEVESIGDTLAAVKTSLTRSGMSAEIIVVDDASTDGTAEIVAASPDVYLIKHAFNKGYGASLRTGIRRSSSETIVIIDADGTYPAEMIPALVAEIGPYDMVVGARVGEEVHVQMMRRPAKWLLNKLADYVSGTEIPDLNSGLRAFKRELVVGFFRLLPSGFSFTTTLTLAMLTNDYNVLFVPVNYYERTGQSKIRPLRDTINFFSLVIRMVLSFRPLRVFVPVTALFFVLSTIKVLYDIRAYDFHIATSTVVLVTLTFQMLVLGLIADLVVSLHKS
jgi:glycosyltransferase involved in cell wall biosynthesis